MRALLASVLVVALCSAALAQPAALKMPGVFGSNMVLQQAPFSANVWGWAVPGESVNVSISSLRASAVADPETGQWSALLDPHPGSGPWVLAVSADSGSVKFSNVMFGDVYICSGQSNMQMTVNLAFNATAEILDAANYPNIRLFTVNESIAYSPQLDLASGASYGWGVTSPSTINGGKWQYFSATCYFFAREISRNVPNLNIGLIATDWGGTYVQAWSSPDALAVCNHSVTLDPAAEEAAKPFLHSDAPEDNPNQPSVLWNAMIYPLLNMTVRGAAWYQGEANAGDPTGYACMFPAMISDWRAKFNQALPFFFVQLAAYPDGQGMYAAQRWAQTAALNLPLVGMGTAIDLGDPKSPEGSIHPRNKQEVGRRLALNALAVVYGVDVVRQGPSPAAFDPTYSGKVWSIAVSFDSVPSANLTFKDTEFCTSCCAKGPPLFEVQDATSTWYNATAVLDGTKAILKLTLGAGDHPVAVRYAWSDYPQCVVFDHTSFLPAPPFVVSF